MNKAVDTNIRTLQCFNPDSKLKGILRLDIPINFCFELDSERTFWPIRTTLYDLIADGWRLVSHEAPVEEK